MGTAVNRFVITQVIPRQKKLRQLGQAWSELLPEELLQHSCLESFRRGQLKILVDSAAHYAELNIIVRDGLIDEIRQKCPQLPVSRIKLVRGQWYRQDEQGVRIVEYH